MQYLLCTNETIYVYCGSYKKHLPSPMFVTHLCTKDDTSVCIAQEVTNLMLVNQNNGEYRQNVHAHQAAWLLSTAILLVAWMIRRCFYPIPVDMSTKGYPESAKICHCAVTQKHISGLTQNLYIRPRVNFWGHLCTSQIHQNPAKLGSGF